ncbi:hypothetical protein P9112_006366 [Eukaryota sp. TZLM1-RC]
MSSCFQMFGGAVPVTTKKLKENLYNDLCDKENINTDDHDLGNSYLISLQQEIKTLLPNIWAKCFPSDIVELFPRSLLSLPLTFAKLQQKILNVLENLDYIEGQVVKWGKDKSFKLIKGLSNIVSLSVFLNCFVAVDEIGALLCYIDDYHSRNSYHYFPFTVRITKYLNLKDFVKNSCLLDDKLLFVIDANGDTFFNNKPTKVEGLSNIVFISGYDGIYAAIDNSGKVFVWGKLSRISEFYEDSDEPRCIDAFTNVESISVGHNFLFAYNKNTVWAWGRNDEGQLGTGDLIDRPQPVKVFGSEILGSFNSPKEPLDRMFSGLIKLIYFEYLQYLKHLFGNHPYTKARFYTKCAISKKVAKFAKQVINGFEFLKNPQDLTLNENICDLQLQLSSDYNGPKVINTRVRKLDFYCDEVDYDPQLLTFSPNVEVVKLGGRCRSGRKFSLNLAHLSNLKCLQLDFEINIEKLPTSLVKLVLKDFDIAGIDLSYLASLKELVVKSPNISRYIVEGQISLPQSIVRSDIWLEEPVNIEIQLPNINELPDLSHLKSLKELVVLSHGTSLGIMKAEILLTKSIVKLEVELVHVTNVQAILPNVKELIIHHSIPTNITEQNFPSLKFIQLIEAEQSLLNSSLSPRKLVDENVI